MAFWMLNRMGGVRNFFIRIKKNPGKCAKISVHKPLKSEGIFLTKSVAKTVLTYREMWVQESFARSMLKYRELWVQESFDKSMLTYRKILLQEFIINGK